MIIIFQQEWNKINVKIYKWLLSQSKETTELL